MPYAWYSINLSNCSAFFIFNPDQTVLAEKEAADNLPGTLSPSAIKKRYYAKNTKRFSRLFDRKSRANRANCCMLKVPKCEIFHLFDFNDFYVIKPL